MVAAQHKRSQTLLKRFDDGITGPFTGLGDLFEISGIGFAKGLCLSNFHKDVAAVGDLMTKGFKPRLKTRDAHRGRSHVDSASAGAHVQWNADDADAARWKGLRAARQE